MSDEKTVLRDQFIEGVRDPSLRRELKKYVRVHPASSLIEVCEEAYLWYSEEPGSKVVRQKVKTCSYVEAEAQCCAVTTKENSSCLEDVMKVLKEQGKVSSATKCNDKSVSFNDVLQVLAEQGKAITELTKAVQELTTQSKTPSGQTATRPKMAPTPDGQPICFKCQSSGHIAKQCPQRKNQNSDTSAQSSSQGNERPWLQ